MNRRKMIPAPARVVLDPALVLRALLCSDDQARLLRWAWQQGVIQPLLGAESAALLVRALAYPAWKLSPDEREELLADYLPYVDVVKLESTARVNGLDKAQSLLVQLARQGNAAFVISECQVLLTWATRARRTREQCTVVDLLGWNQVLTPGHRALLL